ncbi:unnamed protein product [Phytophthora lilii]|uniref:Unnamed protein product n=1 Tax=Phytophthora lilii TaxID=2077276 RepID=A0A9W6WTW1_9STRA|nr:unnamed protein product [Phytophthora lilii]
MLLRRLGRQEEAVRVYWGYLALDLGQDAVREKMPDELARAVLPAHGEGSVPKPSSMRAVDDLCNQEDENDGVTVVCVKWGTKYGPGYVNKLYNSVMRHSGDLAPTQVTFVCLTDDSEGIELHETMHILPLSDGWKGWWNKCQLFSSQVSAKLRELGHSRCLYLDLDTVIVGTLSDLLMVSPRSGVLALLKTDQMTNEQREGGFNSSIMAWHNENAKSLQFLHSFLQDNVFAVSKYIYKFDHWLEMAHPQARFLEDIFPGQIVEYRSLDEKAAMPPTNASVVCFPLQPKPHTATAQWVAKHWI